MPPNLQRSPTSPVPNFTQFPLILIHTYIYTYVYPKCISRQQRKKKERERERKKEKHARGEWKVLGDNFPSEEGRLKGEK